MEKPTENSFTPMMQQYLEIKKDYSDYIVFFRIGDFYEMFFEDAEIGSRELEIVLTGKDAGQKSRVPMCGIPFHAANVYLEKLVEKGYKVAICEQVEDPALAKGLVRREVIKLITPGTIVEDGAVDEKSNNYIVSVAESKEKYLLAYSDLTTGQNCIVSTPKDPEGLWSEILNLHTREIVIGPRFNQRPLRRFLQTEALTVSVFESSDLPQAYKHLVSDLYDKESLEAFGRLINYLRSTQKQELAHFQKVQVFESTSFLRMDYNSKRNLELVETYRFGSRKGSLFWLLDQCRTAMGSRFLKQNILRPLVDKKKIENRFSLLEALNENFLVREDLKTDLREVYDLERILGRISFGNANAKDLVNLARSLRVMPGLKARMESLVIPYAVQLVGNLDPLRELEAAISAAIIDNPPVSVKEGGFIREGYDPELDRIRNAAAHGKDWLAEFEAAERERTGIKKLRIGYNRVFGYYIEVTRGQLDLVREEFGYERKQTLSNSERFVTPELKEKETLILGSEEDAIRLEYDLFVKLRDQAKAETASLQEMARAVSEIDMLLAFAQVSADNRYVRPFIIPERSIEIIGGRHPVVEKMLDNERYVENDVVMPEKTSILLITGPNMSGKSTYMRQTALAIILMQMGCFVPCQSARLPIFDQIFTRIGAADDLTGGKSTFMVEMLEVNHAVQNATADSLILFDEIGRGTATYDGMALAQSIIEYCHAKIKAKILFSTHYHELTYLEDELKGLHNVHVMAKEDRGNIVFLHKVADGPTDRSYGIHVAKLASLPAGLIHRAQLILTELEKNHGTNVIKPQETTLFNFEVAQEAAESACDQYASVLEQLKALDINALTPIKAMNILADVVEEIKKLAGD
ncbi:MAG TPA: DNA mismatch repair protein MutS [Candidatus Izemoplasmatales bacterium]|nr:DNA mismatch repair protein MutS [Candidatus Izemoplasmatales bacterium]